MIIDFEATQTFNQSIDIEDPGNCCIRCESADFSQWYLIIKSIRGNSYYLEFGPVLPDSAGLALGFSCFYNKLSFNEKKLYGIISKFLNDPRKAVSSASIDDINNALEDFIDVAALFNAIS